MASGRTDGANVRIRSLWCNVDTIVHLSREENDPEQYSQKADTVNITRHKPVRRSLGSIGCGVNRAVCSLFTHRFPHGRSVRFPSLEVGVSLRAVGFALRT
jgi:hypothetical protein